MKPGARTRPLASRICSDLEGLNLPILVMREPVMRRLALQRGAPVPSASWALMMTRDGGCCWEKAGSAQQPSKRIEKTNGRRITLLGKIDRVLLTQRSRRAQRKEKQRTLCRIRKLAVC